MQFDLDKYIKLAYDYAPKIALAVLVLIVGFIIIKTIIKILKNTLIKYDFDKDLVPFICSMSSAILKILLLFSVAEMVGIKTTSFIAMLAAAGFAVGMALQGSLGNFASGVMILIFKPYKAGDLIEVDGKTGWVEGVEIFNTLLKTATNQNVIIPNSKITGDTIINHSTNGHIRVDLFFGMPYEENVDRVRAAILTEIETLTVVNINPAPAVNIQEFESHYIKMGLLIYTTPENYWDAYYQGNLAIKRALGKNNIKMAYSEGIELGAIGAS